MCAEPNSPATLSRRAVLAGAGATALTVLWRPPLALAGGRAAAIDAEVATAWFDLATRLVRDTPGFPPPVAARAFGYAGVALYEAVAPGADQHRSLAGALPGLDELPTTRGQLDGAVSANVALATVLRDFFGSSPDAVTAIDALEAATTVRVGRGVAHGPRRRAADHGRAVGDAIVAWSRADGAGSPPGEHTAPIGPGYWVPTPPAFAPPLLPGWGANRCLAITDAAVFGAPAHTPYSEEASSAFHAEAVEVYDAARGATAEQLAIARFWSDDPGQTATPPGHSISVATQVLRAERASLLLAGETYAKVGLAVADAFVACWHTKYRDNLLRPVTYIQRLIDPEWLPPLVTPPFPEYTSGHSVQSGAAFAVLADLFGQDYAFDDHTHDERGLPARHFDSFAAAAGEAAVSRLYGGIHFRPAIDLGLDQGRRIGDAVNNLPFRH